MFVIMEYCGGMIGEEVPLLSLKGILFFQEETRQHKTPHIMLMIKGRFKGETGYIWHLFPFTDFAMTKIPVRPWFFRGINRRVNMERRHSGQYFIMPYGKISKLRDYNNLFNTHLTRTNKEITRIVSEKTNPESGVSLWRSGRRGSTSEVMNQIL